MNLKTLNNDLEDGFGATVYFPLVLLQPFDIMSAAITSEHKLLAFLTILCSIFLSDEHILLHQVVLVATEQLRTDYKVD